MQHKDVGTGSNHIIHNYQFADIAQRDQFIGTEEDLLKVCLVLTPFSYYTLSSINPIKWEQFGGGTSENNEAIEVIRSNQNPTVTTNPSEKGILWANYSTNEIFMCMDNTLNQNIWKGNNGTSISPKPVYKFDILGDNSAVSFLQLDDDLTDMGGAYTIATANTVFEVGKMGKCLKSSNDNAKLDISGAIRAISFWAYFPSSVTADGYFYDCRGYGNNAYCYLNSNVSPAGINLSTIFQNKSAITAGVQFTKGAWVHIAINLNSAVSGIRLLNNLQPNYGISNVKIDHVRCFNRVLTTTDLEKLFAEV